MQKTGSDAVIQHERESKRDPEFNLLVVMRLKPDGHGRRNAASAAPQPSNRDEFRRLGTELRPMFEKLVGFHLFLSGEVVKGDVPLDVIRGPEPQFVNLWTMGSPGQIPSMMSKLLYPPDKTALYGQLDELVLQEVQDAMRVYPVLNRVPQARPGKKLFYALLTLLPESSDMAAFYANFAIATDEVMKSKASFQPLISSFSMTGLLNRIVQFWSLEVDAAADDGKSVAAIEAEIDKLTGWYSEHFRRQPPAILKPTPWDVTIMKKLPH